MNVQVMAKTNLLPVTWVTRVTSDVDILHFGLRKNGEIRDTGLSSSPVCAVAAGAVVEMEVAAAAAAAAAAAVAVAEAVVLVVAETLTAA